MQTPLVQLPLELVNGILGYLDRRPYGEVVGLVQAIHANVTPQVQAQTQEKQEG